MELAEAQQIISVVVALLVIAVGIGLVPNHCNNPRCEQIHRQHVHDDAATATAAKRKRATERHRFHAQLPNLDCDLCRPDDGKIP